MTPNPLYRTQWRLLAAGCLALLTVFGLRNLFDFQRIEREEMLRLEAQVQMIEAAVGRQFGAVNHVLNGVRAELPRWRDNLTHAGEAQRYLTTVADAMLFVRTLIVLDAQGVSQFSNRTNALGKSFAQRDYFQAVARQSLAGMLYVTPPDRDRCPCKCRCKCRCNRSDSDAFGARTSPVCQGSSQFAQQDPPHHRATPEGIARARSHSARRLGQGGPLANHRKAIVSKPTIDEVLAPKPDARPRIYA